MRGLFICVEGIDGCGKTTVAEALKRRLTAYQRPRVELVHNPGTSELGKRLRPIILDQDLDLTPTEQVLLYTTARHSLTPGIIAHLHDGGDVVADRWVLSTYVYQGMLEYADKSLIRWLHDRLVGVNPDVYIVLDVDPETGIHRKRNTDGRGGMPLDRFEVRDLEWRTRLREAYLEAAENLGYPVVDGNQPLKQVLLDVRAACNKNKRFRRVIKTEF